MPENEIEKQNHTLISENNTEKVISKEDLDKALFNTSEAYTSLAELLVDRMEKLDILTPVVEKNLINDLTKKIQGLSVNLLAIEKDLDELKTISEKVEDLLKKRDSEDELVVKQAELELLPNFEEFLVKTGLVSNSIEALSEYYFTHIQAVVDSLESNAIKKHDELSKIIPVETTDATETTDELTKDTEGENDGK